MSMHRQITDVMTRIVVVGMRRYDTMIMKIIAGTEVFSFFFSGSQDVEKWLYMENGKQASVNTDTSADGRRLSRMNRHNERLPARDVPWMHESDRNR